MKQGFKMVNELKEAVKDNPDDPHSKLTLLDKLMFKEFNKLDVDYLENIRFELNKIIKRKKEYKRVEQSKHNYSEC